MSVRIGHASIDERGTIKNGSAGDQTGKEVCIRSWYAKGWKLVLRHPSAEIREKMAAACEKLCTNNLIGYDQNQRNTAHSQLKQFGYDVDRFVAHGVKCETDCSAFMTLCALVGGVLSLEYTSNAPTTSTMQSAFKKAGYDVLTATKYLNSDAYLLRGDILVQPGHHTVMVLDNGSRVTTGACPYREPSGIMRKGSKGEGVKWVQWYLNKKFSCNLDVDGDFGKLTDKAVREYQGCCGLQIDGQVGPKTKARLKA